MLSNPVLRNVLILSDHLVTLNITTQYGFPHGILSIFLFTQTIYTLIRENASCPKWDNDAYRIFQIIWEWLIHMRVNAAL